VLFSRKDLADYISQTFEPAWETVRPAPLVHVDFGNGNVLTRTLQGNIATYICTADGYVIDVLPCIYDPVGYREGLEQLAVLAKVVGKQPSTPRVATLLVNYHLMSLLKPGWDQAVWPLAGGIASGGGASGNGGGGMGDMPNAGARVGGVRGALAAGGGKFGIEGGFKTVLASPRPVGSPEGGNVSKQVSAVERVPPLDSAEDLANWKVLRQDTRLNETVRRRQVHALLADKGLTHPGEIAKFIYKEVLHTDLDDPYLGLGNVLFANYPFSKEDKP
jgi:hypothetical protein